MGISPLLSIVTFVTAAATAVAFWGTPGTPINTRALEGVRSTQSAAASRFFKEEEARYGRVPRAMARSATGTSSGTLELQNELRRLAAGTSNGVRADPARRERIENLVQELNALNPIEKPAFSPLLAGKWRLLYTNQSGPSAGQLGPFVGDVVQEIRLKDMRVANRLNLGPSWAIRGAIEIDVQILDEKNWAMIFDVVYNNLAGIRMQEKIFDRAVTERRIWHMTYLDENFRVVYGRVESMPLSESTIFIMERDTASDH